MDPDPRNDLGGGQGADAVEVRQRGSGGLYGYFNVVDGLFDPAVEVAQLNDEINSQGAQRLSGCVTGAYGAQQLSGPLSVQITAGATRNEVSEHDMESVDGLRPGLDQIVAMLNN
jgi:hypothetical protein